MTGTAYGRTLEFQFLIGRLANPISTEELIRIRETFQFLIGRLANLDKAPQRAEALLRFNSS